MRNDQSKEDEKEASDAMVEAKYDSGSGGGKQLTDKLSNR